MKTFPLNNPAFLWQLLFSPGAGLEISGESGSGKSEGLLAILRKILPHLHFVVLVDPDNDTAEKLHRICLNDPRLARRTIYFQFNDPGLCGSFDPLAVIEDGDPLVTESRRVAKVEHLVRIILAAWGETDLNSRPVLAKNLFRILLTCSRLGLSFTDSLLFLDVFSPLYPILCRGVPDPIDRYEMLELPMLRPIDRESQLGSTQNRIQGVLRSPLVRAIFSKTRVSGAFDFEDAYRRGLILIFNLHRGTTLRLMDQQMLANLVLASVLDVIMSRPLPERRNALICVEELPVFRHSEELLQTTIARIRKFKARFAVCHQGVHTFQGGVESSLLAMIRGTFYSHLFFRASNKVDATHSSEQIQLPTLNLKEVKFEHWEDQQYQDGNDIITLTDHNSSTTEGNTRGGSDATADTKSLTGTTSKANHQDAQAVQTAIVNAQSQAASNGTTRTSTDNWSDTSSNTNGVTHKQTVIPRMAWRKILKMVEFWTAEEQYQRLASRIAAQQVGQAFLYFNGLGAQQFRFPLLPDPFAATPNYALKKLAAYRQELLNRPEFDPIEKIEVYRAEFLNQLVEFLRRLPPPSQQSTRLALPGPLIERPPHRPQSDQQQSPPDEEGPNDGPWTI